MRRQLALTLLLGPTMLLGVGCKSAPWSSGPSASAAPNTSQHQFESLSKAFSTGGKPASGVGGPVAPSENWFVSSWNKTTAAIAAPFSSKGAVDTDDPVSLANRPDKVGPAVYISAAQIMENQGKFAEAEHQYNAALKANPKDLNTLVSLARCYDRQGKTSEAIDTYRKALKSHPKSPLVHNDLGLCFGRQHTHDEAVKHLLQAVELEPENVRYRNNLATVLVEAGRTADAYQQLAAVNSEAVAHYNLACLLHMHHKPDLAAQQLQFALQKDPSLNQARELLAQLPVAPQWQDTRVSAVPVSMPVQPQHPAPSGPYQPQYTAPPVGSPPAIDFSSASPPSHTPPAAPQQTPPQQQPFSPWR